MAPIAPTPTHIRDLLKQVSPEKFTSDNALMQMHERVSRHVHERKDELFQQIPLLSRNNYQTLQANGSLVRIDCMIQDIFDREMEYLPVAGRDISKCPLYGSHEEASTGQCEYIDVDVLYTVPIGGLHESTSQTETDIENSTFGSSESNTRKRKRTSSEVDNTEAHHKKRTHTHSPTSTPHIADNQSSAVPSGNGENSPDFWKSGSSKYLPCIAKYYHSDNTSITHSGTSVAENPFKMGGLCSIVGVLTTEAVYFPQNENTGKNTPFAHDAFQQQELNTRLPSNNLVPRIYALHTIQHESVYSYREWVRNGMKWINGKKQAESSPNGSKVFEQCVNSVTQYASMSRLAAKYLLLHLMSRTKHTKNALAINKLNINLYGLKDAARIEKLLELLTAASITVPFCTSVLNEKVLYPQKNHEKNKLELSVLQQPPGTHLLLDETQLQEGKLNEQALKNIQALKQVISQQTLPYDYQFDVYNLEVDVPVMVVSQQKSILHDSVDVCVRAVACEDSMDTSEELEANEEHLVRAVEAFGCVVSLRRDAPLSDIPEHVKQQAQEDFVRQRKEQSGASVGSQDLGRWITMARLVAQCRGESLVSTECWQEVMQMERERLGASQ